MKSLSLFNQNTCIMGAAQIREELHQFINRADERVLNLMYGMMKADSEEGGFTLSEAHKQLLDERLAEHAASPKEGYGWEEVKTRIRQKA
jgi:putative addiction module component (TIGR02574 family)